MPPRRSLRVRLTGIAALGATVVSLVAAAAMFVVLTSRLDTALSTELAVRAADVEAEIRSGSVVSLGGPLRTQVLDGSGTVVLPVGDEPLVAPDRVRGLASGTELDGPEQRLLVRRVATAAGERLVVVAGSTASIRQARNQLLLVFAVAGPALLVAVVGAAWVLTGAALAPVRQMTRRAETISVAGPGERLPEPDGDDEIADLAATLNHMLDRISRAVQHERSFIDNASHELRTPLAVLRGELELLGRDLPSTAQPEVAAGVSSALEETDRLTRLAEQLLVLARIDAGESTEVYGSPTCSLDSIAGAVARRSAGLVADSGIEVVAHLTPKCRVDLDADSCERIVTNLVSNAVRHAHASVLVSVTAIDGWLELVVADDGPGFATAVLEQPFERFVRGDADRQGTGLGLAIVAGLAGAAGGSATLGNGHRLGGAWVRVLFPTGPPH